ncbi:FIP1 [Zea mays]|uniref:FIP1 n=1 Tax=Zea mays TaxID=4577 RepID=A0A1D6JAQ3_MAIZE|nr:FIP1 [Zea mays]
MTSGDPPAGPAIVVLLCGLLHLCAYVVGFRFS